jgi:hypothetical protein
LLSWKPETDYLLLDPDPPHAAPRRVHLPPRPCQDSKFIEIYNRTAKPFRWSYDAKLLKAA